MTSVEAVAKENGSVLSGLPANGMAVFPADDPFALHRCGAAMRTAVAAK